ncbi:MAG: type III-A CRISPR-associated protein Cas10/Csm1 [Bacteroides sp.]|nr:type III-A CRISPR-associated protein Cas10/Csm1 [Bacteroides sp.]MCM1548741.1 type III-A CRISPR-associated protein Cas10/Csm1 [Clostridium sp.]
MTDQEVKIVIGGLLHDIGKTIYRSGDGRKHSKSGYDFLKEEVKISDKQILDSVLYHHADALHGASIEKNSNAYITYISDNIASAVDRRKREAEDYGFEMSIPLQPVFNILNGNSKDYYYHPMLLEADLNYPTEQKVFFTEGFYAKVKERIKDALKGIDWTEQYINSLLEVLEGTLSFIPSSTAKGEIADISLFDHVKLTAALNSCIYQYLKAQEIQDYKEELFNHANDFYEKEAFLMYAMDISGIQNFIYTIHSKDALKMLRARSFYLEIVMEHMIDSLLERLGLSRANLIYSGGGHCYILLPNTDKVKMTVNDYEEEINAWLLEQFDISLYVASGFISASANTLKNIPEGSYADLFRKVSNELSEKKAHRYSASTILYLNHKTLKSYNRECRVCKRLGAVDEEEFCDICASLKNASKNILYQPFFVVLKQWEEYALPLPGGYYLLSESEEQLKARMKREDTFIRVYAKNKYYTGMKIATKIWVGNYTQGQTFEELAEASKGIKRLGVFRADVDNLGQAFTAGFDERYNTLSRTAALSRHLSLFFKYYINELLAQGDFSLGNTSSRKRNATIVYSGGDDLFIVGAWNEIIELALDIRNAFDKYTEHTLTLSGGIGIYTAGYPVSSMAQETGQLEELSKRMIQKDAITIFPDGCSHEEEAENEMVRVSDGTYKWKDFEEKVIREKYLIISEFFKGSEDRGKAFLYHLLELIRNRGEKINFARYVYVLSRMEPNEKASEEQKELYRKFSRKMYEWMKQDADCRQLRTAMNLYAYYLREEKDGEKNGD